MLLSDMRCSDVVVRGDLNKLCLSLVARLGAAAVEGAVGRLIIQNPFWGRCAPGRVCSVLDSGSA